MALKWGFGKKEEKETKDAEPQAEARESAGIGEAKQPESPPAPVEASALERKRILIMGNGFSAPLWIKRFQSAGLEFSRETDLSKEDFEKSEFEILIETTQSPTHGSEANEDGSNAPHHAPALASDGFVLVPCYTASPTQMAHTLEGMSEKAVGYALFDAPNEEQAKAPLLEVARPLQSDDATWEKAVAFLKESGFAPEVVGDAPGLVFARVLACLINEASFALGDGISSVNDIDAAMQLGVNYPKGLFRWADELGLDFIMDILHGLVEHYEEDRYRPSLLLRHMLLAGKRFHS